MGARILLVNPPIYDYAAYDFWLKIVNLDEPLWHNKTLFAAHCLGEQRIDRLKALCRELNRDLLPAASEG